MTEDAWDRILRLRIILRQILTNPEVSGISIAERVEAEDAIYNRPPKPKSPS